MSESPTSAKRELLRRFVVGFGNTAVQSTAEEFDGLSFSNAEFCDAVSVYYAKLKQEPRRLARTELLVVGNDRPVRLDKLCSEFFHYLLKRRIWRWLHVAHLPGPLRFSEIVYSSRTSGRRDK